MTIEATITELPIDVIAPSSFRASVYHLVVNPSQGREITVESLNENSASSRTGPNRITSTRAVRPMLRAFGSARCMRRENGIADQPVRTSCHALV